MTDYAAIAERLGRDMSHFEASHPNAMTSFADLMTATAGSDRALSVKTKELIAFAIGIAVRCDGCIAHHAKAVARAGASHDEVAETIGVAIMMGGGPSVVYGTQALRAFEQFSSERDEYESVDDALADELG